MRLIAGKLYSAEDDATIVRMRDAGAEWKDISAVLGRSIQAIERHVISANLPVAKKLYTGRREVAFSRATAKNEVWTDRKCLCCARVFRSWGNGNRMCDYCRRFERAP